MYEFWFTNGEKKCFLDDWEKKIVSREGRKRKGFRRLQEEEESLGIRIEMSGPVWGTKWYWYI